MQRPADFTRESFNSVSSKADLEDCAVLAGLTCFVGDTVFESTLCAANGAGHQNLIVSIRDVMALATVDHLRSALFGVWRRDFVVSAADKKRMNLGQRKPTLRLDSGDERLYALRFSDPTTTDDFTTEIGAQALATAAFSVIPVLPRDSPIAISSVRKRNRVYFSWPLWEYPVGLSTVRSLLAAGVERSAELRCRGVFAAFSAARVSGDRGKLSFSPTEGRW